MNNLSKDFIYNLISEQIKNKKADINPEHLKMIKRRIETPEVSEWFKDIEIRKKLKVIELGCSFGFLAIAESLFGKLLIKDWKGYDCDATAIEIINNIKSILDSDHQINLDKHKFTHSAVTSFKSKSVYSNNKPLLSSCIAKTKSKEFNQRVPNINYEKLPASDILLIDIEGEEINIDLDKISFDYCILETNTEQATNKIIKDYMSRAKRFKIIKNHKLTKDKNLFFIRKKI